MKFKKGFICEFEETLAEKKRQDKLRKKYKIDQDVVVVEKNNIIKTIASILGKVIKIAASAILAILAGIGLMALFYEIPRNEILRLFFEFWESF